MNGREVRPLGSRGISIIEFEWKESVNGEPVRELESKVMKGVSMFLL